MIKPRIDSIETLLGESLDSVSFDDPKNFQIIVRAIIGPDNAPGKEFFDITVRSHIHLLSESKLSGYVFLSRSLVLDYWDATLVDSAIRDTLSKLSGRDWKELVVKISAFSEWEFENYRDA